VFAIEVFVSLYKGKQHKLTKVGSKRIIKETQPSAIEMNPMMKEKGFADLSVEAYIDSPPKDIWISFKHLFQSQKKVIQSLMEENKEMKQALSMEERYTEHTECIGKSFKKKSFLPLRTNAEQTK